MRSGTVLQVAAPRDLYRRPADRFVASFIGTMNILDGIATGSGVRVDGLGEVGVSAPDAADGAPIGLGIRPDDVVLLEPGAAVPAGTAFAIPARVETTVFAGSQIHTVARDAAGRAFTATAGAANDIPQEGAECLLALPRDALLVLPDPVA
jgi:ABC-type Fe3+/spermidine/putrescine transport system ATPase subunit